MNIRNTYLVDEDTNLAKYEIFAFNHTKSYKTLKNVQVN